MEGMMWLSSSPAEAYLGMSLAPHFKNPYVSESLTDFWARRWNITQGLVLRFYVYEPIVQGRLVELVPPAVPGAAEVKAALPDKQAANSRPTPPPQGRLAVDSSSSMECAAFHQKKSSMRRHGRKLGLCLHPSVASLGVLLLLGMTADAFFWGPVKAALLQPWMLDPVFWWWDVAGLVLPLPPLLAVLDKARVASCLVWMWLPEWMVHIGTGAAGAAVQAEQCLAAGV
eukprot:gene10677-10836_t